METKEEPISYKNTQPRVMSLLYDLNLLPEQCTTEKQKDDMNNIVEHFKFFEEDITEKLRNEFDKRIEDLEKEHEEEQEFYEDEEEFKWYECPAIQTIADSFQIFCIGLACCFLLYGCSKMKEVEDKHETLSVEKKNSAKEIVPIIKEK